jgi:hypothetical protein
MGLEEATVAYLIQTCNRFTTDVIQTAIKSCVSLVKVRQHEVLRKILVLLKSLQVVVVVNTSEGFLEGP